jgi:hypothetical protein
MAGGWARSPPPAGRHASRRTSASPCCRSSTSSWAARSRSRRRMDVSAASSSRSRSTTRPRRSPRRRAEAPTTGAVGDLLAASRSEVLSSSDSGHVTSPKMIGGRTQRGRSDAARAVALDPALSVTPKPARGREQQGRPGLTVPGPQRPQDRYVSRTDPVRDGLRPSVYHLATVREDLLPRSASCPCICRRRVPAGRSGPAAAGRR